MNWIKNTTPNTPLLSCTNIIAKLYDNEIYEDTVENFDWEAIDYYLIVEPVNPTPVYHVHVMERWAQTYRVNATSPEEALEMVRTGKGEVLDDVSEFRENMNTETWEVEEI